MNRPIDPATSLAPRPHHRLRLLAGMLVVLAACGAPPPPTTHPVARALARLRDRIGAPAPELTFRFVRDDSEHRLSEFRGKVVLLNVWTTGCGPCWTEMPKLVDLQELHGDHLAVVTLTSSDPESVRYHAGRRGVTLPPLSGYTTRLSWERPPSYPLTVLIDGWVPNMIWPLGILIDAEGKVQAVKHGLYGVEQLISTLPAD